MSDLTHPVNLEQFVAGKLSEAQNKIVLEHMAICDSCADEVDALWEEHFLFTTDSAPPELDAITAKRLERSVFQRIHRSVLGGEVIRLSTRGTLVVCSALLRPLTAFMSRRQE